MRAAVVERFAGDLSLSNGLVAQLGTKDGDRRRCREPADMAYDMSNRGEGVILRFSRGDEVGRRGDPLFPTRSG